MSDDVPALVEVDPFDLPDWLGTSDVVWTADTGLRTGHRVTGSLQASDPARVPEAGVQPCDLLAVDEAHPVPVAPEGVRTRTHLSWRLGQVLLVARDEPAARLTLAVPGSSFSADLVLDAVARLARAVGGSPERYTVALRIGEH
ncbi:hypothetical protein [Nocardioides acrostichi]|uniref:Uncharacterized protein n=1 Tax=Nocardioides acrostichi TaxID=2784339 RepID=A0A930V3D6_9ACTN|nr:hypothetical protein [Nocardioides acrostichi]MBF4163067.1 hypothetical protein [Nocardioides acrostichi]